MVVAKSVYSEMFFLRLNISAASKLMSYLKDLYQGGSGSKIRYHRGRRPIHRGRRSIHRGRRSIHSGRRCNVEVVIDIYLKISKF